MAKPPPKKPPKEFSETAVIPDAAKKQQASKPQPVPPAKGAPVAPPPMWNYDGEVQAPPGAPQAPATEAKAPLPAAPSPEASAKPADEEAFDEEEALAFLEASSEIDGLRGEIDALEELVSRLPG